MAVTGYHMGLSVRGALFWDKSTFKKALKWIFKGDGSKFGSIDELRDFFLDQLSQGHENLPMGDCDNWDWKKGCQGHEVKEQPAAQSEVEKDNRKVSNVEAQA